MRALIVIIPIYFFLFAFYGVRKVKHFLLFTGIVSIPLETTYSLTYAGTRAGWSSGIQISLSDVSFILLFMYFLFFDLRSLKASPRVLWAMVFFILASCLSVINSCSGTLTLYHVISFTVTSFLYYIVTASFINSEEDLRSVLSFLMITLIIQGSIGCLQYLTGYTLDIFTTGKVGALLHQIGDGYPDLRVLGTTPHPNSFASYLVPLILLSIFISPAFTQHRTFVFFAIVFGTLSLIFTLSRGGWISFWFSLFIFSFRSVKCGIRNLGMLKKLCVISIVLVIILSPLIYHRMSDDDQGSAYSRIPLIKLAYNMIKDHPIVGVGANTFSNIKKEYVTPDIEGEYLNQVHNTYLLVFAETGLIGFLAFVWLLVVPYREIKLCLLQETSMLVWCVGLGIFSGLVASAVHMMVDLYNSRLLLQSMFLSYGIISSASRLVYGRMGLSYEYVYIADPLV